MAVPSGQTKTIVDLELAGHLDAVEDRWPGLEDVVISWRGSHGYLTAVLVDGTRARLARIGYLGGTEIWDFALFDPATETYTPSLTVTGGFQGTIAEVFDTAAIVHLTE